MIAKVLENFFRKLLPLERYAFGKICRSSGLQLDYRLNREGINILNEVFVQKVYAAYFPLYEKACIVDVGAHFGYFSFFAALNTQPDSRIFALEPFPDNFDLLRQNLAAHSFSNITPLAIGLGGKSEERGISGHKSFNQSIFGSKTGEGTSASLLSLADFCDQQGLEQIDFLKLDCEGAEYPILLDSTADSIRRAKVISMEFHDLREEGYRPLQLVNCLESAGFDIRLFQFSPNYGGQSRNFGKIIGLRKD
ncbi:MAG: FkbM family methyltransferase [Bacteroidota bacterium]